MAKYNMTFEEAQEYISKRGFDIAWNDCDVFVDERYITQTVGNVLKWADNNPVEYIRTDAFIERAAEFLYNYNQKQALKHGARATLGCGEYTINVDEFINYMKGE